MQRNPKEQAVTARTPAAATQVRLSNVPDERAHTWERSISTCWTSISRRSAVYVSLISTSTPVLFAGVTFKVSGIRPVIYPGLHPAALWFTNSMLLVWTVMRFIAYRPREDNICLYARPGAAALRVCQPNDLQSVLPPGQLRSAGLFAAGYHSK